MPDYHSPEARRLGIPETGNPQPARLLPSNPEHQAKLEELMISLGPHLGLVAIGNPENTEHKPFTKAGYESTPIKVGRRTLEFLVFAPGTRYYPSLMSIWKNRRGEVVGRGYYATSMSAEDHPKFDPGADKKISSLRWSVNKYLTAKHNQVTYVQQSSEIVETPPEI